jgi:hypothetical protein
MRYYYTFSPKVCLELQRSRKAIQFVEKNMEIAVNNSTFWGAALVYRR